MTLKGWHVVKPQHNQSVYMQVYLHIYIHIYVQVGHNFDTFYAIKLKFGMIFTQTKTLDFILELPLGLAPGQDQKGGWGKGNSHMGKGHRAGASVYFGHMSSFLKICAFWMPVYN